MSEAWYEITALAARYFFLGLAAYIVYGAIRLHVRANRESARLRAAAGAFVGELTVSADGRGKLTGNRYPLPIEGVIGRARSCDVRIPSPELRRKHLYYEQRAGCLCVTPLGGAPLTGGETRGGAYLVYDGDKLKTGGLTLLLTFFDREDVRRAPVKESGADEGEWTDAFAPNKTPPKQVRFSDRDARGETDAFAPAKTVDKPARFSIWGARGDRDKPAGSGGKRA